MSVAFPDQADIWRGDMLTPEEFAALKAELQRLFARMGDGVGWLRNGDMGKRCPFCGEWKREAWVGHHPQMCITCFINGVRFEAAGVS
jgi:hypothetical protein